MLMKLTTGRFTYPPACVLLFPKHAFTFPFFFSETLLFVDSSLCSQSVISTFVSVFEQFFAFSFSFIFFNFHFDITLVARMAWKLNFSLSLAVSPTLTFSLSLHALAPHARTALWNAKVFWEKKKPERALAVTYRPFTIAFVVTYLRLELSRSTLLFLAFAATQPLSSSKMIFQHEKESMI